MSTPRDRETHEERLNGAVEICRALLDASDAQRWEVFAKTSLTRQTDFVDGRLRRTASIEENGVGVRFWDGCRAGFAAASGLEPSTVRTAVDAARLGAAPSSDPMPPHRLLGTTAIEPGSQMPAQGWAQHITSELEIALATMSDGGLRLGRAIVQEGSYRWCLTTAEDWAADFDRMVASIMVEVLVDERPGTWREWIHIPDPQTFDAASLAARIGNRALLTRHNVATDQGLHDLILHPEVSAQLMAGISPLFLATAEDTDPLPGLLDSNGLLSAYALTVVDDRSDPTAPIVSPCDGEGLPARRTLLLDEGAPRHRVASFSDARRFDEVPRGGAVRFSYRDRPATGVANLKVLTDDGMPAGKLLGASTRALYLLRPLAPVICDLERDTYRLIASGVWLDRQRVRGWHPVVELSGSLGTLLRRIDAVGTDLSWFQTARGFVGAPSLLIRRQPVVG
jgi:PmbA protein